MKADYDVVTMGGAVIRSSVACFLTANPDFDGTVLVLERDPGSRFASVLPCFFSIHRAAL